MSYHQRVKEAAKRFGRCQIRPQDTNPELLSYRLQLNSATQFNITRPEFLFFSWKPSSQQLESLEVHQSETPIFIDSLTELRQAAEDISCQHQITVDVEATDLQVYYGMTCIIQISTTQKNYVFDALKLQVHIRDTLGPIFENPNILKVFHGTNDLQWMQRDFRIFPIGILDMQEVFELIHPGIKSVSFQRMVKEVLSISIDKIGQYSDWRKRPLHPELLSYAVKDTRLLFGCWEWAKLECSKRKIDLQSQVFPISIEAAFKAYEFPKPTNAAKKFNGDSESERELFYKLFAARDQIARLIDMKPAEVITLRCLTKLMRLTTCLDRELSTYFEKKEVFDQHGSLIVAAFQPEVKVKRNKFQFNNSSDESSDDEWTARLPKKSTAPAFDVSMEFSDISDTDHDSKDPDLVETIQISITNEHAVPPIDSSVPTSSSFMESKTKDQSTQTPSWHLMRRIARRANKEARNKELRKQGLSTIPYRHRRRFRYIPY